MFLQFLRLQRCYGIKKLINEPHACLNLDNDAVRWGTLNPRAPVFNCGRGRYSPCIPATPKYQRPVAPVSPPSPKPDFRGIYKRNGPPGGH
ncbi:LOW QUALITY PROTEIN: hypothetical protein TorRG33x02_358370 [Trema orientale]|uniref:Uncharacterized protein n=1 Tax=Trema orientale TaxID=63057 RepID=A0A2P5A426_TREOI|nr:LOW QUALITY PROTEIN: hypothetical protein TorRG33x02_358370 [Trema orientale]